jgi:hypothetical protein
MNLATPSAHEEPKPGPIKSGINELLNDIADHERPPEIPIAIIRNNKMYELIFRQATSTKDVSDWKSEGIRFLFRIKDHIQNRNCPEPFLKILDLFKGNPDEDDLLTAWGLHYWSHPDHKIDEGMALAMVARDPILAADTLERVDAALRDGVTILSYNAILNAKKDSRRTGRTASASKPPSSSSTSTRQGSRPKKNRT